MSRIIKKGKISSKYRIITSLSSPFERVNTKRARRFTGLKKKKSTAPMNMG